VLPYKKGEYFMIFGALSKKETDAISKILEASNIQFSIVPDSIALGNNDLSMQNNLRHLNSPSISTNVLAIELSDHAFDSMNEQTIANLLEYGITNIVPSGLGEETADIDPQEVNNHLLKGNKNIIGVNFIHQIILAASIFVIGWFIQQYYS
jgi:hypothetical protein